MEFEDHVEEHDDEEMNFDSVAKMTNSSGEGVAPVSQVPPLAASAAAAAAAKKHRYRECLKNHAVGLGGHALDGCGEFMPAGDEGTLDALKCAACNCHRNFHRKESDGGVSGGVVGGLITGGEIYYGHHHHHHHQQQQFAPYYRTPGGYLHVAPHHQRPLALPSTSGGGGSHSREDQDDDGSNPSGGGGIGAAGMMMGGTGGSSSAARKRYRTKFTADQKEKMLEFAEKLGWRIQKHDEAVVLNFCNETGVKRHVLKVWMHNNKHTLGKKP